MTDRIPSAKEKWITLFIRLALAIAFLSAVADRFGMWSAENSAWGDWAGFVDYTSTLNPWWPSDWIPSLAGVATAAELLFGLMLLVGLKTKVIGLLSGFLLLLFALSMAFATGIKHALDYSVFSSAGAAFSLSLLNVRFLSLDGWIENRKINYSE